MWLLQGYPTTRKLTDLYFRWFICW